MSVRIEDNLPRYKKLALNLLDDALNEAADNVLDQSKRYAPFKKGGLRGSAYSETKRFLDKRIWYDIEYATYQHEGQRRDGSRKVRNYNEPGTGKKYLSRAGNEEMKRIKEVLKKHARRADTL